MLDVYSIKETLAERGCPVDLKIIKKALLIQEEPLRQPGTFVYPTPGATLMKNPWPKKAKKKKGKKGKKWSYLFIMKLLPFGLLTVLVASKCDIVCMQECWDSYKPEQ